MFEDLSVAVAGKGKEGGVAAAAGEGVSGKEGVLDLSKMGVTDVVEEVDRHSRALKRKEELSN